MLGFPGTRNRMPRVFAATAVGAVTTPMMKELTTLGKKW